MYNIGAVYEVIGRVVSGTSVMAYTLRDRRNNTLKTIPKNIFEQLALNKQIYNCSAQIYNEIVNLKGINCKLNKLPKYDEHGNRIIEEPAKVRAKKQGDLQLIGKVQDGHTIKAYILRYLQDNKTVTIPREQVLKLALTGRIINAKSQRNGNQLVLRGDNGFSLSQLKNYNG